MIAGKRFVIWGLSRLTTRVVGALTARRAEVVVVREGGEKNHLLPLLGADVNVVNAEGDRELALREAGVALASCLLALADDDLTNLQAAVTANALAPGLPVVLRTFDPVL